MTDVAFPILNATVVLFFGQHKSVVDLWPFRWDSSILDTSVMIRAYRTDLIYFHPNYDNEIHILIFLKPSNVPFTIPAESTVIRNLST